MISAHNDTDFRRREHVLFHTNEPTTCTCFTVPGGSLNVAVVDFDPHEHGEVEPIQDGHRGTFELHPAVQEAMASNLKFNATINGRTQEFTFQDRVVDHRRVRIDRWKLRDAGASPGLVSEGTFWLWTYTFHQQATIRYELLFFYENLAAQTGVVDIGFSVTGPTNLRELVAYHVVDPNHLTNSTSFTMKDAAGVYVEGCLPFETSEMRANRTTNAEAITQSAQMLMPLYALVPHATWGMWSQDPLVFAGTPNAAYPTVDFGQAKGRIDADARDPFRYLEYITHRQPRGQGRQHEFGAWTHVYNIGDVDARSLWYQHTASMRHVNRPVWYTEDDGEPLIAANHAYPNARVFDEMIHWAGGEPVDRFRRASGRGNAGGDWEGHDVEHVGWNHLVEDFLLTGSFAARHMLISIQSNMNAHAVASSGFSESRAVGRWGMAAAQCWRATGVSTALLHYLDLWPQVYTQWLASCDPSDPFRPYVSPNRGASAGLGFEADCWLWIAWQAGILIAGIDAVLQADDTLDFLGATIRAEMVEVQLHEANALVNLAFAPQHTCGSTTHPDATRWTTHIKFGTGVIPVSPGALDYCNDTGTMRDVNYGGFDTAWVIMGVRVARRIDPTLAARCDLIEGLYRPGMLAHNPGGGSRDGAEPQYLGAG